MSERSTAEQSTVGRSPSEPFMTGSPGRDVYWIEATVQASGDNLGQVNGSRFRYESGPPNSAWHIYDVKGETEVTVIGGVDSWVAVNGKRLPEAVIPAPWQYIVTLVEPLTMAAAASPGSVTRQPNSEGGDDIVYATGAPGVSVALVTDAGHFTREITITVDGAVREHLVLTDVHTASRHGA
jgi:hypothetical protein